MKHSLIPAMLAALFLCVPAVTSQAVDFQIKGQWNMGFGLADTKFTQRAVKPRPSGRGYKESSPD